MKESKINKIAIDTKINLRRIKEQQKVNYKPTKNDGRNRKETK